MSEYDDLLKRYKGQINFEEQEPIYPVQLVIPVQLLEDLRKLSGETYLKPTKTPTTTDTIPLLSDLDLETMLTETIISPERGMFIDKIDKVEVKDGKMIIDCTLYDPDHDH